MSASVHRAEVAVDARRHRHARSMKVSKRLIDITGLRDIIQRRIAVITVDSEVPGPVVWLTACIHGDEVGGTAIVHDVLAAIRQSGLNRGVVHALPLVNSMGFENVSRFINSDGEDLNRCFPGDSRGSMGKQLARRMFDIIRKTNPDLVIDLHNDWVRSVPYVLIDPSESYPSKKLSKHVFRMARATGLLMVEDSDVFHPLHNTLAGSMIDAGVAAFTIEAGGAFAIVEDSVAIGANAVLSALQSLQMIDDGMVPATADTRDEVWKYTGEPLCTSSGLIRFAVVPGQKIKRGQVLARVYSAFGSREETLKATGPGIVLGLEDHARVLPGREVIAIAGQG